MNVIVPKEDITNVSFVVQWDAVINHSDVKYEVNWLDIDNPSLQKATVTETSYTVTGLTPNTSYLVTVAVLNKKCKGHSPHSVGITIKTKILLSINTNSTTSSANPTTATTSTATTTATTTTTTTTIMTNTTTMTTIDNFVTDIVLNMNATSPPAANSKVLNGIRNTFLKAIFFLILLIVYDMIRYTQSHEEGLITKCHIVYRQRKVLKVEKPNC